MGSDCRTPPGQAELALEMFGLAHLVALFLGPVITNAGCPFHGLDEPQGFETPSRVSKEVAEAMSNIFFRTLLSNTWESHTASGKELYKAVGGNLLILRTDYLITLHPELLAIAQDYAQDNQLFLDQAAAAWTKLSNADRFDGP